MAGDKFVGLAKSDSAGIKKDIVSSNRNSNDVESHAVFSETTADLIDPNAERALCRKFDLRLLPILAIMYLFNALDKGNLGNAQTAGLSKDLNFKEGQYNQIVGIFFVPYVLFAPPLAMLGKKYGPALVLPVLMFCFGSLTLLTAATKNFGGVFALRWFLGMAESGFFPLVIYYLTTFYRRGELARRLAIFYAASNIANAFSGLLAFGVFQIKSTLVDHPWRWLFIVEGSVTVCFSIFAFFYLPRSAAEARFLNEEEKALAYRRIQIDSSSIVNEKFVLRDSLKIFKRPTTYGFLITEICLGVPLQSVNIFLPQIVQGLVNDTVTVNLYTVAPNVTGAVMLLVLAFTSDGLRIRFPFVCLGFAFTFIGFIIYASISDVHAQIRVAYFATFMMCWGTSAPSVLLSTWYNNNVAHEGERLTLTSVGVPLANLMGLVSSYVFQEKDAPKYLPALITTASFGATGCLVAGSLGLYMLWDNKSRNRRQGVNLTAKDVPTLQLRDGPKVEEFRWFL
ncbi:putative MFS transporter [Daldinia vernicosa]|uniref:putative MFS transporter n=1 Tax=Daldinia vernicosa TaxID=114800 RepID=UPI002007F6FC|nr:putative MFS transporter [Daldinia vernicosa]KAI0845477.1 putative MFS transporter [Daldinia vernicosa]